VVFIVLGGLLVLAPVLPFIEVAFGPSVRPAHL
jgi:hypothetical protein